MPGSRVKDKMAALEARKAKLESLLAQAEEASPVLLHRNMGKVYREEVAALAEALNDKSERAEASALIRKLIDRIVLTPVEYEGRKTLAIDLQGRLAGILAMATKAKKPHSEDNKRSALWEANRDAVLAEWIAAHPGTRPSLWWRHDAPEPRDETDADTSYLKRLGRLLPGERRRLTKRDFEMPVPLIAG